MQWDASTLRIRRPIQLILCANTSYARHPAQDLHSIPKWHQNAYRNQIHEKQALIDAPQRWFSHPTPIGFYAHSDRAHLGHLVLWHQHILRGVLSF